MSAWDPWWVYGDYAEAQHFISDDGGVSMTTTDPNIAAAAQARCWLPIETACKDRTPYLMLLKNPIPRDGRDDLRGWNGVCAVFRHNGLASDGFDIGWQMAAPVGSGGFPDDWFIGWMPIPVGLPEITTAVPHHPTPSVEAVARLLREYLPLSCGRNCEREMTSADEDAAYSETAAAILALTAQQHPALGSGGATSDPFGGWRSDTDKAPRDGTPVDLLLDDDETVLGAAWGEHPDAEEVGDWLDREGWLINGDYARSEDQRVICWRPTQSPPPRSQERAGGGD